MYVNFTITLHYIHYITIYDSFLYKHLLPTKLVNVHLLGTQNLHNVNYLKINSS